VGGFVLLFFFISAVIVASSYRRDFEPEDVGDTFEKASIVARYADQRLAAASRNVELPAPPRILADQGSLQFALLVTLVQQGLLILIVLVASKQSLPALARAVGLNRYNVSSCWRPIVAVIGAYTMVAVYVLITKAIGISWLEPQSTVPSQIARDGLTLAIAGIVTVVGAPLSEELFFRGLIFSGLAKWRFWPAALISGGLFTAVHFDPGSIIPFYLIAITMAWLYWSHGTLWDSIFFHVLFNLTSFAILATTA
jgi:membrane protease YdiL (CAAX protease family)